MKKNHFWAIFQLQKCKYLRLACTLFGGKLSKGFTLRKINKIMKKTRNQDEFRGIKKFQKLGYAYEICEIMQPGRDFVGAVACGEAAMQTVLRQDVLEIQNPEKPPSGNVRKDIIRYKKMRKSMARYIYICT